MAIQHTACILWLKRMNDKHVSTNPGRKGNGVLQAQVYEERRMAASVFRRWAFVAFSRLVGCNTIRRRFINRPDVYAEVPFWPEIHQIHV